MNMKLWPATMPTKSPRAAAYAAAPTQSPKQAVIWGPCRASGRRAARFAVRIDRVEAFFDANAVAIGERDDGQLSFAGEVEDAAHFPRRGVAEAAAEHGRLVGEDRDGAAVDPREARDHAVPGRPVGGQRVVGLAMENVRAELDEAPLVDELFDALARGEPTEAMMTRDAGRSAAFAKLGFAAKKLARKLLVAERHFFLASSSSRNVTRSPRL